MRKITKPNYLKILLHHPEVVQPPPLALAGQSDRGWTVQIMENIDSLKTKNKLRALITK